MEREAEPRAGRGGGDVGGVKGGVKGGAEGGVELRAEPEVEGRGRRAGEKLEITAREAALVECSVL